MTGDVGEVFNDWRTYKKAVRATYGILCPRCKEQRPKAHPTILVPNQRCFDGYRDPRPRLTEEQIKNACKLHDAPYFERVK